MRCRLRVILVRVVLLPLLCLRRAVGRNFTLKIVVLIGPRLQIPPTGRPGCMGTDNGEPWISDVVTTSCDNDTNDTIYDEFLSSTFCEEIAHYDASMSAGDGTSLRSEDVRIGQG